MGKYFQIQEYHLDQRVMRHLKLMSLFYALDMTINFPSLTNTPTWIFQQYQMKKESNRCMNSCGPNKPGRIRDTHYLGQFQWDEALKYAKFSGLYDENLKRYIMTNKAIYEHTGKQRKQLFPGGVDTYRYNSYVRDDENESFQFNSLL